MESEFPSNSKNPAKKPVEKTERVVEKVVTGDVVTRKKPLGKRFAETFVGGDARGVGAYVFFDVLIPAAKDMVADAMSQGVERMLFGEVRSHSRRSATSYGGGFTSYHKMSRSSTSLRPDPRERERERYISRRARTMHDFDEIVVESRLEGNKILEGMYEILANYDVVTVADLYTMAGITSTPVDRNWGWTDLSGSGVHRIRNGYLLDLPRPEHIE